MPNNNKPAKPSPKQGNKPQGKQPNNKRRRRPRKQPLSGAARAKIGKLPIGLAALALPRENPPVRYPVFSQAMKTAVFNLYADGVYQHKGELSITNDYGSCFLLCPSPIHPVWALQRVESTDGTIATINYRMISNGAYATVDQLRAEDIRIENTARKDRRYPMLAPAPGGHESHSSVHVRQGQFYVPENCELRMFITGLAVTTSHNVNIEVAVNHLVDNGTAGVVVPTTGGAGEATVSPNHASWCMIKEIRGPEGDFANSALFKLEVRVQPKTQLVDGKTVSPRVLLPLFPIIEESTLRQARECARVTAASLLLTNTTTSMYKGGAFLGARILSNINNPFAASSYIPVISARAQSERYSGKGELGLYTFTTPSTGSMTFSDYILTTSGDSAFLLEDLSVCNIACYFTSETGATTGSTGVLQEFLCVLDYHMESRLTSQVFPLRLPRMTLQDYEDFLTAASAVVPFTENPTHVAALAAKIAQMFWAAAPYLVPLAQQAVAKGARYINKRMDDLY